jgi:hypothetical protein
VATYRQIVNKVLTALSEDEIPSTQSSLDTTYHKLVGLFVNEIKETVEDAHNWRALRETENVTISAGATTGTFTNANDRSRVVREQNALYGKERPLVFDITDPSDAYRLREIDIAALLAKQTMDPDTSNNPCDFCLDMAGGTPTLRVWPAPTAERTIAVTLVTPQPALAFDELDTVIKVPDRPISAGATWYALEERGEELGVNGVFSAQIFDEILGSYIARDSAEQGGYELVPE